MDLTHVMVVDDSDGDQFIAELAIKEYNLNITITRAYDGAEALEKLLNTEHIPELILLDINMPRMDGHEFLKAYNEANINQSVVISVLTSSSQVEDKKKTLAYDYVKSYLIKPVDSAGIEEVAKLVSSDL